MSNGAQVDPVGGQAVVEGVMMRAGDRWAVAVRRPDESIAVLTGSSPSWAARGRTIPVVRGIAALSESLAVGTRALLWSAAQAVPERANGDDRPPRLWPMIAAAIGIVVGVFFVVPAAVANGVEGPGFHAAEAGVRLGLFLAYLVAVGRLPDVRRVFQYHGAEHKVVTAHEQGVPLTPAEAARFGTIHPRCGTSFLLVVMLIALAAHAFVGRPELPLLIASRVLAVPVAAGLAYEVLRFTARHAARRPVQVVMAPALALQRLTTREPDAAQLEVAIVALETAVDPTRENGLVAALAGGHEAVPSLVA